jgi:hypothetical protein
MPGIAVIDKLFRSLLVTESQPALLPTLSQIILTGSYLSSTNSILMMLESRSLPHEHCSSLIAVEIGMKDRSLTVGEIARFSNLSVSTLALTSVSRNGIVVTVTRNGGILKTDTFKWA